MYTSHGVIVELNHLSWWFWNAPLDAHGTTTNSLALKHPASYKEFITNQEAEDHAQWTRVFVMPHAVVGAVTQMESNMQ